MEESRTVRLSFAEVRNDAGLVGWTLVDENFDGADMDAFS